MKTMREGERQADMQAEIDRLKAQVAALEAAQTPVSGSFLDALHETALSLMQHHDLDNLLEFIIERAGELADTTHGFVYLLDDDTLKLHAVSGVFVDTLPKTSTSQTGITAEVQRSGKSRVITDYDNWAGRLENFGMGVIYSIAAIPLKLQGRVIGVLALGYTESGRNFSPKTVTLLQAFADMAALAVDNAYLFAELNHSRHFTEKVTVTMPAVVQVYDTQTGYIVYMNRTIANTLGYSTEDIEEQRLNESITPLIHPDDLAEVNANHDSLLTSKSSEMVESIFRVRHKDGSLRTLYSRNVVFQRDAQGNVSQILSIINDITQQTHNQKRLAEREALLSAFFETAKLGILIGDSQQRIFEANPALLNMLDYTFEDLQNLNYADYVNAEDLKLEKQLMTEINAGTRPFYRMDKRFIRKDGSVLWTHVTGTKLNVFEGDTRELQVIEDITERKRAEDAVQKSEHRFRTLMESVPALMFLFANGKFAYLNPAAEHLLGTANIPDLETQVNVIVAAGNIGNSSNPDALKRHEVKCADVNGEMRWLDMWLMSVNFDDDSTGTILGTALDVTARKQRETHKMALALEKQRMNLLADFIDHASHDLRTPLSTITTSLYLVERHTDPARRKERIEIIKDQVRYLNNMVEDMLTMTRIDSSNGFKPGRNDLYELFQTTQEKVQKSADEKSLALTFDIANELPVYHGDGVMIGRALKHLLDNAIRYTPEGGTVDVRCYQDGSFILVSITDSGVGIPEEEHERIFDSFYRIDKARSGGGTGLGLSIVRKIIERHKGSIYVDSNPGTGSTFIFALPLHSSGS